MATNRDLAMVNAAIKQQNTMQTRIAKMQQGALYANNTAESLLKSAKKAGYTIPASAYQQAAQPVQNTQQTSQQTTQQGGITAESLMNEYQQWLSQQSNQTAQSTQDLSSGGYAGAGYQQYLQNNQQIPSLNGGSNDISNEDLAKQINIAEMVKNQNAQSQEEQDKNVADILAKLNNDSSMVDKAKQLINQRNTDYTNLTGKTDYDDAVQRTLQNAIPSLADTQSVGQNTAQSTTQNYSNEDIAKIIAQASGGNESDILNQLNSSPEMVQQAKSLLAQRDSDYAALQNQQTAQNAANTQQTSRQSMKAYKTATADYKKAQAATVEAKKKVEAAQKKVDDRQKKIQSLEKSLEKAKKTAQKTGHYEQVNAIQQQIRGMQDTSAENNALKKATEAYNRAKQTERLKQANQAILNPTFSNKNQDQAQTAITSPNGTFSQSGEDFTTTSGKGGVTYNNDGTVTMRHGNDTRTTKQGVIPSLLAGFGNGFTDMGQKITKTVAKALGTPEAVDAERNLEEAQNVQSKISEQNPKSYAAGNVAGTMLNTAIMYGMANAIGDKMGATDAAKSVIQKAIPSLSGKALETAANLAVGQAADTLLDTTPTAIEAYQNGASGTELANTIAENQAQNLVGNFIGEGADKLLAYLKSNGKTAEDAVSNIAKNANLQARPDIQYQSPEDAGKEFIQLMNANSVKTQSAEDADAEARQILSQYLESEAAKNGKKNAVSSFLNNAENTPVTDEEVGSIVKAAQQNQVSSGERALSDAINKRAVTESTLDNTATDFPTRYRNQQKLSASDNDIRSAVEKIKQARPDLAENVDSLVKEAFHDLDLNESSTKIYKDVADSGLSGDADNVLGDYRPRQRLTKSGKVKGSDTYDANMSVSNLAKHIDNYEAKYGVADDTVKEYLDKAKAAVNDISDAIYNGKPGLAEEASDNYRQALKDLSDYSKKNVDGFDPKDLNGRAYSATTNNILGYQSRRSTYSKSDLMDEDAIPSIQSAAENATDEVPSLKKNKTMAESTGNNSVSTTSKIPEIEVEKGLDDGTETGTSDLLRQRQEANEKSFEQYRKDSIKGTSLEGMPKVENVTEPDGFKPTHYKESYGINPVDDVTKQRLSGSKKIIVNDGSNFKDFVETASKDGTFNKNFLYGKVSDELANDTKKATGIDVSDYNIMYEGSRVRKEFGHHGTDREYLRGQTQLTKDNFEDFVKAFDNPDSIKVVSENDIPSIDSAHRRMIQFEKRIDGKDIVVTGVSDGRKTLYIDSFYETKAKEKGRLRMSDANISSDTRTSKTVSGAGPISNLDRSGSDVNVPSLDDAGYSFDQLKSDVKNGTETQNPMDAEKRVSEMVSKQNPSKDDSGYVSKTMTNTFRRSGLATDEQYAEDLKAAKRYFTKSEQETFKNGSDIVNNDFDAAVKRYSSSMEKKDNWSIGSDDVAAMNITYGRLNKMAVDEKDPVKAAELRRKAQQIAINQTEAAHHNGQVLQSLSMWTRTPDGAIMSADGVIGRLRSESMFPKQVDQIDEASKAIRDRIKEMTEGGEIKGDSAREAIREILNSYSTLKGKIDDNQLQKLTDSVLKDRDFDGLEDLLSKEVTEIRNLSADTLQKVYDCYDKMDAYDPGSKQYAKLKKQAFQYLADDISSQPGFKGGTFSKKLDAWRYMMMLANVKTNVKNIGGNATMFGMTEAKDDLAGLIEASWDRVSKATGGDGIERTKTVLNKLDRNLINSAKEYGENHAFGDMVGNKYKNSGDLLNESLPVFGNSILGRAAQKVSDITSNVLDIEDQAAMMSKYKYALARYIKANGYDASIFKDTSDEAKQFLESASEYAVNSAKEAAFHQDNDYAKAISNLVETLKNSDSKGARIAGTVADSIIPFKKTPANVLQTCIDYSPVQLLKSFNEVSNLRKGLVKPKEFIDDVSKGTTGTAMTILGAILVHEGVMKVATGKGSNEQNTDTRTGLQDRSVEFNIGGKKVYVGLSDLAPVSAPIINGATIYQTMANRKDGDSVLNAIVQGVKNVGAGLIDMTMLSGISGLLDAPRYASEDESSVGAVMQQVAGNFSSQLLPTMGRAINNTVEDNAYSTYSDKTDPTLKAMEQQGKYLETKVPGLPQLGKWAKEKDIPVLKNLNLEPAIDAWGNEKKNNAMGIEGLTDNKAANVSGRGVANFLSPTKVTTDTSEEIDNKIRELKNNLVDSGQMSDDDADELFPYTSSSEAKIGDGKLSPSDWTTYQKEKGKLSHELATELLTSGDFDDMDDLTKGETLQELYKFAKNYEASKFGGSVSDQNKKKFAIYEEGGASALIEAMQSSSAHSSYTAQVKASNKDGKTGIDYQIDYLNAVQKQDASKAKEMAEQASDYQNGTFTLQKGKWVYKNAKGKVTYTGNGATVKVDSDGNIPSIADSTDTSSSTAVSKKSSSSATSGQSETIPSLKDGNDMSKYIEKHKNDSLKYDKTSTVGASGYDYKNSDRFKRVKSLGNVGGVTMNGYNYEKAIKEIDTDGSGRESKAEITAWVNNMADKNGWDQETKRKVYAAFAPKNYKNPY